MNISASAIFDQLSILKRFSARPHARAMEAARAELRALFDEVADVDWRQPQWRTTLHALALSEVLSLRKWGPDLAVQSFVQAMGANSGVDADTFMATPAAPLAGGSEAAIARAVDRAHRAVDILQHLDGTIVDQPVLITLDRHRRWLTPTPLPKSAGTRVAFLINGSARLATLTAHTHRDDLAQALFHALAGRSGGMAVVDPSDRSPTPAALAIALDPVQSCDARSFHRRAWTQGGGPWMGIADCPPHAVVSTCHVAVDGYVHAQVADAVFGGSHEAPSDACILSSSTHRSSVTSSPQEVADGAALAFASVRLPNAELPVAPRFAAAVHAFGTVLDRHLGSPEGAVSVPFHIPIAVGAVDDESRWRKRPLYGLLALRKNEGELESLSELSARLPAWLGREAKGGGLLSRVLRATLELPAPDALRQRLLGGPAWTEGLAPARILKGGGYLSWMRFDDAHRPSMPLHPSALPSFAQNRGGAGLSITHGQGGLAIGLTTCGPLGTPSAAREFLEEWLQELRLQARTVASESSPECIPATEEWG